MATAADSCLAAHFELGSCNINLKQGDLMYEVDVDVVVIPTPESGQTASQKTYPLFEALLSNADKNLEREIKACSSRIRQDGAPQIIRTSKPAFILTATPYFQNKKTALQMLSETYLACFNLAVDERCQTIAVPTIGCGGSGFQTEDAATALHYALIKFQQSSNKQFKEIRIIVFKKDMFNEFTNVFIRLSNGKNSKIKFIERLTTESHSAKMSSKDSKQAASSQRHHQGNDTPDYENDFEEADTNQRDRGTKQKSSLNPNSSEFRPKDKVEGRGPRRYRINNKKTELLIVQGDILKIKFDAVVNAANESMLGGSGVDGLIHKAAGEELYKACKAHKRIYSDVRLPTGHSRILLSYNMSRTAHYIINTAGPRYDDHSRDDCRKYLASCYETSLALANLYDLETIGYTAISCGIFGYPIAEAAEVALLTVDENAGRMKTITFVLWEDEIYDDWVKKAEQLQFISLDDTGSAVTSTSKQPAASTRKVPDQADDDDDIGPPKRPFERSIVDRSTENNREKSPMTPRKTPDTQETSKRSDDDSRSNEDPKKKSETSENKNKKKEDSPNKSPKPQPKPKDDKKGETAGGQTDKSQANTSVGREKAKKK